MGIGARWVDSIGEMVFFPDYTSHCKTREEAVLRALHVDARFVENALNMLATSSREEDKIRWRKILEHGQRRAQNAEEFYASGPDLAACKLTTYDEWRVIADKDYLSDD